MDKKTIRNEIKYVRELMTSDDVLNKSGIICKKLFEFFNFELELTFLLYADFKNEVATSDMIRMLQQMHKKIYLPVVCGDDIIVAEYNENAVKKGAFGIMEPDINCVDIIQPSDINVFIVPGIAFDKKGGRIGFGRGFYDRLLSSSNGKKIAICFDYQIVDNVFPNEFDVAMDYIVTESRIIEVPGV